MNQGLMVKYDVTKIEDGSQVNGCFVLRPDIDSAARDALWAYTAATDNKLLAAEIQQWLLKLDGDARLLPPTRRKIDEVKTSIVRSHYELVARDPNTDGFDDELTMILKLARHIVEHKDTLPIEYLCEDDKINHQTYFGINMLLIERFELMELLHYKALALKHNLTLDEEVD